MEQQEIKIQQILEKGIQEDYDKIVKSEKEIYKAILKRKKPENPIACTDFVVGNICYYGDYVWIDVNFLVFSGEVTLRFDGAKSRVEQKVFGSVWAYMDLWIVDNELYHEIWYRKPVSGHEGPFHNKLPKW
ncbi:hypothetical protein G6F33_012776 [Rhizopus arrhizus]|nr:hypothetical protein G6F33_012776 [Rhizopus arrhizus]